MRLGESTLALSWNLVPVSSPHRWSWGETGLGALCKAVADHMYATDDPALKAIAFGIAR